MNLQESIVTTTLDVFSGMLFMTATPQEAVEPGMTHLNSISGIIGFGGRAKGMLAVHTPEEVAKTITGGFLGVLVEEINDDVNDAIGELANMLAGSVKHSLAENIGGIILSVPSVICGDSYTVNAPLEGYGTIIPFSVPGGLFYVEFHYVETE